MWPTPPPDWLLLWAIWRFKYPEPRPARTDGGPRVIPPWAWGFLKWAEWRRKLASLAPGDPIPPRPASTEKAPIPKEIPKSYWTVLKLLNAAVPPKQPPPPPPPAHPVPPNSWKLPWPAMFTSWGPGIDWLQAHEFENFLQRCVEARVATVLLQIGMFNRTGDYPQRVRDHGLRLALWTPVAQDRDEGWVNDTGAEGYVPQIEGSGEYVAAIRQLEKPVWGSRSLSVVTTNSGLDTFTTRPNGTATGQITTVEGEELNEVGCTHHMVECYTGDMMPFDVGNKMWENTRRGAYYNNPIAGLADRAGVTLASYDPDLAAWGRQFGIYLAEPMRTSDWSDLRAR